MDTSTAVSTGLDLSPLLEALLGLAVAVISALGVFATRWVQKKIGVENLITDEKVRGYLDVALDKAVEFAIAKARERGFTSLKSNNEIVQVALKYANDAVPGALAHFGITEQKLYDMVTARLEAKGADARLSAPSSGAG